jgi:hypothetical protein
MTPQARLFVALLGIVLLLYVLRSLRAHRLRFEYSLLWLLLSLLMVALAVFQRTADRVARWLGFDYPPAFFLLLCFFLILLILFHLTLRLSVLGEQLKEVAQAVALLEADDGTGKPQEPGEEGEPEASGDSTTHR